VYKAQTRGCARAQQTRRPFTFILQSLLGLLSNFSSVLRRTIPIDTLVVLCRRVAQDVRGSLASAPHCDDIPRLRYASGVRSRQAACALGIPSRKIVVADIAFPGEKGGFPEAGIYHDFSRVLAGYDTTAEGETLVGFFIAGYREARPDHGLFTLLFVLSIFSVGVDLTPINAGARPGTVGTVAPAMIEAIRRGGAMKTDLSDNWDHWPWIELPLDEARHRLGVADKQQHGPGTTD
jgi:hypothetical protein